MGGVARVVVVCGRNEALRQQVQSLGVEALGFVDNVAELMRSADILITKAGGLTLAEAFCSAVPVVVYDVLPGQEPATSRTRCSQNAIVRSRSPADLVRMVQTLRDDVRPPRGACRTRPRDWPGPDAAARIVQRALSGVG